ncbi:unnamed protein product [Rotaria sp. Silwood2]|nr:unnamed protein product [Rotaria sp. Silwood2]CAF4268283.1 unnamed protein product [Rotaria sp. Silwood2]
MPEHLMQNSPLGQQLDNITSGNPNPTYRQMMGGLYGQGFPPPPPHPHHHYNYGVGPMGGYGAGYGYSYYWGG